MVSKQLKVIALILLFTSSAFAQDVIDDTIKTEATTNSTVTTKSDTTTTLKSPPPSAISPTINTSRLRRAEAKAENIKMMIDVASIGAMAALTGGTIYIIMLLV